MKPNYSDRAIVIGAGLSGLAAAQALNARENGAAIIRHIDARD